MTFWRWLLVHSLSISILLMLGAGYFFKNELKLNEAYSQLLQIDSDSLSSASSVINTMPPSKSKETKIFDKKSIVIQTKDAASTLSLLPSIKLNNDNNAEEKKSVSILVEETVVKEKQLISNSHKKIKEVDYLLMARQAYWNKDFQSAINIYRQEIEKNPNSSDLYGELGNVYYGLKEYDLASINYLEAGRIMIEENNQVRAKQIYDILISIAPIKAEILLSIKNNEYQ